MITITVRVDAPPEMAQGIKEILAMELERFGDVQVVDIRADQLEQKSIWRDAD